MAQSYDQTDSWSDAANQIRNPNQIEIETCKAPKSESHKAKDSLPKVSLKLVLAGDGTGESAGGKSFRITADVEIPAKAVVLVALLAANPAMPDLWCLPIRKSG